MKTWSPENPFLYDLEYKVIDKNGKVVDEVRSYTGMRKVHIEGNKIYLNNKPYYQRLVLDQGFYPDGIWTATSDAALKRDAAGRKKELSEEIGWIESRRGDMLGFWSKVEEGTIPTRVTHNDTKINNILFDRQGEVLCAIDLDTVMASTSLNDFGDAIRSYANTGDEDDRDLSRVGMSLEMFRAYPEGYLSQRAGQLNQAEIDHLAFSACYITFEQVLRFLMDYINGDTYYKTKYPEHNLVRTHAQYKLLQSMEEQYGTMCEIVRETVAKYK